MVWSVCAVHCTSDTNSPPCLHQRHLNNTLTMLKNITLKNQFDIFYCDCLNIIIINITFQWHLHFEYSGVDISTKYLHTCLLLPPNMASSCVFWINGSMEMEEARGAHLVLQNRETSMRDLNETGIHVPACNWSSVPLKKEKRSKKSCCAGNFPLFLAK